MKHAHAAGIATAVLLSLLLSGTALADNVDKLVRDLGSNSDYKVRISAAASLAKLGDKRSIRAFVRALERDSEKTVRGAAAVGLGKVVTEGTDDQLVDEAMAALDKASRKDKDSFVKKQAAKSLQRIEAIAGERAPSSGGRGAIYVDVGQMSAKVSDAAEMKGLMRKTIEATFGKSGGGMTTRFAGKKSPSKKDLKGTQAFHVDGTLNELSTKSRGSATIVSCKVNMLIATYPEKSMFGFLNGGASVQASSDPSDIALAKKDCVSAVVEDLVIKKIIPTIRAKAGQ